MRLELSDQGRQMIVQGLLIEKARAVHAGHAPGLFMAQPEDADDKAMPSVRAKLFAQWQVLVNILPELPWLALDAHRFAP